MKLFYFLLICFLLTPIFSTAQTNMPDRVPGEVIIKFKSHTTKLEKDAILKEMGAETLDTFHHIGATCEKLNALGVDDAIARFSNHKAIQYIEPNRITYLANTPNDPLFPLQYALDNTGQLGGVPGADIRAEWAWEYHRGNRDIIVAIIDSGMDLQHPDLMDNLWTNEGEIPGNGIDDDGNSFIDDIHGFDMYNDVGSITDDNGHGTHLAGIIGASCNNNEGIAGVCWEVSLMPVRYVNLGHGGSTSDILCAIGYAIDNGANILNLSWGSRVYEQSIFDELQIADDAGILMVAAAGNYQDNNDEVPFYPASFDLDHIISVTGTGPTDQFDNYNYGKVSVDLAAPGTYIHSTLPGGNYGNLSGSSMSAPFVTGALVLLMDAYPEFDPLDLKAQLLAGVVPLDCLEDLVATGGRLDLVAPMADSDQEPPAVISDFSISTIASNWVSLQWTAPFDSGHSGTAYQYEIRYSTSPLDEDNFPQGILADNVPLPSSVGSAETYDLWGLDSLTSYYFGIRVSDVFGNISLVSSIATATTLGIPTIGLSDSSFTVALETDETTTRTITLSNTGNGILDFHINGEAPSWPQWLSVTPLNGHISSGQSQDLVISFDATELCSCQLEYMLEIFHNDSPENPSQLPLSLTVAGETEITVSETNFGFGEVALGRSREFFLTVYNAGCDLLTVHEVSIDDPSFHIDTESFSLTSRDSIILSVIFTPLGLEISSGNILLASDDPQRPEIFIPLTGEGIRPPEISLSHAAIDVQCNSGETIVQTIELTNTGGCDLNYGANVLPTSLPESSLASFLDNILVLKNGSANYSYPFFSAALDSLGLSYVLVISPSSLHEKLVDGTDWDMVLVNSGGNFSGEELMNDLTQYVDDGGLLLFSHSGLSEYVDHPLVQAMGLQYHENITTHPSFTLNDASHMISNHPNPVHSLEWNEDFIYPTGQFITPTISATGLATFDGASPYQAIIHNQQRTTVFNAFQASKFTADNDGDGTPDMIKLIENEISFLAFKTPWANISPHSGVLPPGQSQSFDLTLNSLDYCTSQLACSLNFVDFTEIIEDIELPVDFNVIAFPDIAVSPLALDYGTVGLGLSVTDSLLIKNTMCDILTGHFTSDNSAEFLVSGEEFNLAAGDSLYMVVTYFPSEVHNSLGTLSIISDDPDEPIVSISVRGNCLMPPQLTIDAEDMTVPLFPGEIQNHRVTLSNTGSMNLHWSVNTQVIEPETKFTSSGPSVNPTFLDSLRVRLDERHSQITDKIPFMSDFTGGESGWFLPDDDSGMFFQGNTLSTNLGSPLYYSGGEIVDSEYLGEQGRYFTKKYPGLFAFACEMNNVDWFLINGFLDNFGTASVDYAILEMDFNGTTYQGFVKRVYNTVAPSINHLVIIQKDESATQSDSTVPTHDEQKIQFSHVTNQLFYLLFASGSGGYIENSVMEEIMATVLDAANLPPSWLSFSATMGDISPGESEEIQVTRSANQSCSEYIPATVMFNSNSFENPHIGFSAILQMTGDGHPVLSDSVLDFGDTFLETSTSLSLIIDNAGCSDLHITNIHCDLAVFSTEVTDLIIEPSTSDTVSVLFTPGDVGDLAGYLYLATENPNVQDIQVDLTGAGIFTPTIAISPDFLAIESSDNSIFDVELAITNSGGSNLQWNLIADFPEGAPPNLTGVRILMEQSEAMPDKSYFSTLITDLENMGAQIVYNYSFLEAGVLYGFDIYWTSTNFFDIGPAYYEDLEPWIRNGGALFVAGLMDHDLTSINDYMANLGAGISFQDFSSFSETFDTIFPHICTRNVDELVWLGDSCPIVITEPETRTLATFHDQASATISLVGTGKIMAVGSGFFRDNYIDQADNRIFAQQAMEWLGGRFWLDVTPVSGTVAPGSSETVTCAINTGGQCLEILSADLNFISNDIHTPESMVPLTIELDTVASLSTSSGALLFSAQPLGQSVTKFIPLTNIGCAPLNISQITLDPGDFSTPSNSMTLTRGEFHQLPIVYTPTSLGVHNGTLRIFSNDPQMPIKTIPLVGSGQYPPSASTSTDSFSLALAPNNNVHFNQVLTNTGGQDLHWDSAISSNQLFPALDGVTRSLVLESGISEYEDMVYAQTLENMQLPFTLVETWPELLYQLENEGPWGLLLINSYIGSASPEVLDLVLDHILMGRRLIFSDANLGIYADHPLLRELGVEYIRDASNPVNIELIDFNDPLFNIPNHVYFLAPSHNQELVDRPIVSTLPGFTSRALAMNSQPSPAIISSANGKVIFNAFMGTNYLGTEQYHGRIITYLINNEIHSMADRKWLLWRNPHSGIVLSGEEITIEMYVETFTLAPGKYQPTLTISTNDPDNLEILTSITIDVTEDLLFQGPAVVSEAGWDMVGIPLSPQDGLNSLGSILLDNAPSGSALFRYDSSLGYIQVEAEEAVVAGQGLWLATPENITWSMSGYDHMDGISLDLQQGWNLVGYPLLYPGSTEGIMVEHQGKFRSFSLAASDGLISSAYFGFDQTRSTYEWNPGLTPGRSYWVASLADSVVLFFDPSCMPDTTSAPLDKNLVIDQENQTAWTLDINCTIPSESGNDHSVDFGSIRIGRHPEGTSGFDVALDSAAPPATPGSGNITGLLMLRPQWEQITGDAAWADIRGLQDSPESWGCLVQPATSGSFTLHWDPEQLPADCDLRLYRHGRGTFLVESMHSSNQFTLQSDGSAVFLEFCTTDFIPAEMWLHADLDLRNAPNPFNPRTEIRFNLPHEGKVNLLIYDLRGAQILKISGGKMSPGPGSLAWAGQTATGGSAASGVYFYRLFLDNKRLGSTGKMMLLK